MALPHVLTSRVCAVCYDSWALVSLSSLCGPMFASILRRLSRIPGCRCRLGARVRLRSPFPRLRCAFVQWKVQRLPSRGRSCRLVAGRRGVLLWHCLRVGLSPLLPGGPRTCVRFLYHLSGWCLVMVEILEEHWLQVRLGACPATRSVPQGCGLCVPGILRSVSCLLRFLRWPL